MRTTCKQNSKIEPFLHCYSSLARSYYCLVYFYLLNIEPIVLCSASMSRPVTRSLFVPFFCDRGMALNPRFFFLLLTYSQSQSFFVSIKLIILLYCLLICTRTQCTSLISLYAFQSQKLLFTNLLQHYYCLACSICSLAQTRRRQVAGEKL